MSEKDGNGNGEFKGFVKSEIRTLKDVAKKNNEEHGILFSKISGLSERMARMEEKLDAAIGSKKSLRAMLATVVAAVIMAAASLIIHFTGG